MNRPSLTLVHEVEESPRQIPFSEMLADHQALLQSYLDTHITQNHSAKTIEREGHYLRGWFEGFQVPDEQHPGCGRQLFLWEAMAPVEGRERIRTFSKGLTLSLGSTKTVIAYLGSLRRLFTYVLKFPYIPGNPPQSIAEKYGRIEQPVSEYDYPVRVLDDDDEDFVLTGEKLLAFYQFVLEKYIPNMQKQAPSSRDYAMIVVAAESGLRIDEIIHLDTRDLFYDHSCIQTRYGKAANGSGKRIRKTIFTPFAQETLRYYQKSIRPAFPNAKTEEALFLNERGKRVGYQASWENLRRIARAARAAGLVLPRTFGWHSLRKSFATCFLEAHPDEIWLLMDLMGHLGPGTLFRYIKHTREYYEQAIGKIARGHFSNTIIQASAFKNSPRWR